jgi:beta-lactam-binding protein with PASTA domain
MLTVPMDLVGRNAGDAKSELAQDGLLGQLVAASPACAETIQPPLGCLVTSVPDAGQQVNGGGTVQVVIDMAAPTSAPPVVSDTDTVTYTVTGRSAGTITYENSTGDTSQVTDTTRLPWKISFTEPTGSEGFLYVSAQNAGSGTIGCAISINGQVVKQNTSTGAYAIVDCSN